MSTPSMSLADALATLSPEVRAAIESQLKRTAAAREFQHVTYSQYYDESTVEGQTRRTPSGISNTNVLKISHNKKAFGKRPVAISISRNRDGTLSISNAAFFPVSSVSTDKNGRMSLQLNDVFNAQELSFIAGWTKAKYAERPTVSTTTEATTTETPAADAAPTAPASAPNVKAVKVALIKGKVKPTDENVALVADIMSQTGATLAEAVQTLAS